MTPVRLGSVAYLNARPLVFGLEHDSRFTLRHDLPVECARLLHAGEIDLGIVPSIEYQRGPCEYRVVPDLAIASRGAVASVALYTRRPMSDVRAIVMDTSSRTSVALVRVLCARLFKIDPAVRSHAPDLEAMLHDGDAALVIGDNALLWDPARYDAMKIDLGEAWTGLTGLPFVWAMWVGRPGAVTTDAVAALQAARDVNLTRPEAIARAYFRDPARQAVGARYLRDTIKYSLGPDEQAGVQLFHRYAAEIGLVPAARELRFYPEP
jgi:chorismate dehydratase